MFRRGLSNVLLLGVLILGLLGCGNWGVLSIPDPAHSEVVGNARIVVAAEDTDRAGNRTVEVEHLVLDLEASSSREAIRRKVQRLTSMGWEKWRVSELGTYVSSDKYHVNVVLEPLSSFLHRERKPSSSYDKLIRRIQSKRLKGDGLIVVHVQAHG